MPDNVTIADVINTTRAGRNLARLFPGIVPNLVSAAPSIQGDNANCRESVSEQTSSGGHDNGKPYFDNR